MASPIKSVALCSATGKFGPFLLKALQAEGFSVTVVKREGSSATFEGVNVITVSNDYREDELIGAFKQVDAVVLCLSFEMLSQSKKFAEASLKAGNRWFIPSTYGANLDDPRYDLFPASIPHKQAVQELRELQKGNEDWAWTSLSSGPWVELAIAANAWRIDVKNKTADLVDGGKSVFTCSTRDQIALAVARVLKKQPSSARNNCIYIASFEVDMLTWLDAHKQIVGSDGWKLADVDGETMVQRSQKSFSEGDFMTGYTDSALAVCTGKDFQNHYSKHAKLANEELELPREDLLEVVKHGLSLPNPFA